MQRWGGVMRKMDIGSRHLTNTDLRETWGGVMPNMDIGTQPTLT